MHAYCDSAPMRATCVDLRRRVVATRMDDGPNRGALANTEGDGTEHSSAVPSGGNCGSAALRTYLEKMFARTSLRHKGVLYLRGGSRRRVGSLNRFCYLEHDPSEGLDFAQLLWRDVVPSTNNNAV